MKGYKVFNPDWTCRGFKYAVGKTYRFDGEIGLCKAGFHFCKKLADCFSYYAFDPNNKVAEIEATGKVIDSNDGKSVTDGLTVARELTWHEVLDLVNTGDCNAGYCNTGDYNTGDCNAGYCNTGDYNTGDCNAGNRNTGDYNTGDYNTGCFNTITPDFTFFNRPTTWTPYDWQISSQRVILDRMPAPCRWIPLEDMTAEEKAAHPEAETAEGYLKKADAEELKAERQRWWNKFPEDDKETIMSLPNFDAKIFEECTLIDVKGDKA